MSPPSARSGSGSPVAADSRVRLPAATRDPGQARGRVRGRCPGGRRAHRGRSRAVVLENARRKARAGARAVDGGSGEPGARRRHRCGPRRPPARQGRRRGRRQGATRALSGRTHEVLSGVVLIGAATPSAAASPGPRSASASLAQTIELYLRLRGVEGPSRRVRDPGPRVDPHRRDRGDFSNVVGLPVAFLLQLEPNLLESPENPKANI